MVDTVNWLTIEQIMILIEAVEDFKPHQLNNKKVISNSLYFINKSDFIFTFRELFQPLKKQVQQQERKQCWKHGAERRTETEGGHRDEKRGRKQGPCRGSLLAYSFVASWDPLGAYFGRPGASQGFLLAF